MKLSNTINEFLFHCKYEKNLSPKTLKAYKIDLNQFLNLINDIEIKNISKKEIKKFIEFLHIKKHKPKTIKRKITTIKALFNYLEYEEIIDSNPFRKIKTNIKLEKNLPKTLSKNEIEKILKTIYKCRKNAKTKFEYKVITRDILIVELLFFTGIRVFELCNLKLDSIDFKDKKIIINGKGQKERKIYIDNKIITLLKEVIDLYFENINKTRYIFINRLNNPLTEQSVRNIIYKYSKLANIDKKITPHMFRHTFASMLLNEGVDIRIIQSLLGHSSILTTQIYTHLNENIYKKVLKYHPRKKLRI